MTAGIDKENKIVKQNKFNIMTIVSFIAVCMSLFHLYTSLFGVLEAWRHRSVHIIFILLLSFLMEKNMPEKYKTIYKSIALTLVISVSLYMVIDYGNIIYREGVPSLLDKVFGTILIILFLEAARRWVGNAMAIIAGIFLIYALFGYLLPGRLASPNFTYDRIIAQLFNSTSGLLGSTAGVAATSVILFIIFGSFLEVSGGSDFFSDFALVATRKVVGGPAKASVIASALVGTIQGNAVSNVVTTGTFTIPLMKRAGYAPHYAGAVEAVASTGGMIMPPVMGAAAFLLAEMTKTPYADVCKHSIIPALLYYLGVFMMIHLHAKKSGIKTINQDTKLNKKELLWYGINTVVPIFILVYLLIGGSSAMRSATIAIFILVIIWIIRPAKRMTIKELLLSLEKGAKSMVSVSVACITAGIIVGTVSLTGLATKIAILVGLGGTNVWLILLICMVVCIIFGMGLPVSASYVIAAITLGKVMEKIGIETMQAHLFLMYFATLSAITPPVALASYAAAGIAGDSPNKVGWQALVLALPGFLVPFIFVFGKEILLIGEVPQIIQSLVSSTIGIFAISIAVEGWIFTDVDKISRVLFFIASLLLIIVGELTDYIGITILVAVLIINYRKLKKEKGLSKEIQQ